MVTKILIGIAAVLFIVLAFVTDFGVYLLLAVIMGLVTWLLTRSGERKAGEVFAQVGMAMVVTPFMIMLIVFAVKSYVNPAATNALASQAIDGMTTSLAKQLPYILLSDVAGSVVGSITGIFQR